MNKYTGIEALEVFIKQGYEYFTYSENGIDMSYVLLYTQDKMISYLFQLLPQRLHTNYRQINLKELIYRFVGIRTDYFKVVPIRTIDRVKEYFIEQYLLYPTLYDMEVFISSGSLYINRLSELPDEYMEKEMYEYLFE